MSDVKMTVRIPKEVADRLRAAAVKERRSVNMQLVVELERLFGGAEVRPIGTARKTADCPLCKAPIMVDDQGRGMCLCD
jgi:hypothetical protein